MTVQYGHIAVHNENVKTAAEVNAMCPPPIPPQAPSSGAPASLAAQGREDRREQIIQIAKQAFFADGYAATSMAAIAAKAGGSKGTLYNYFPSKEQLFEAVVAQFTERGAAVFAGLEVSDGDFRAALTRFGKLLIRHMMSDDAISMHRLIAGEAVRFPEIGEAYYRAVVHSGKQRLIDRFEEAMAAGHIRRADPQVAAQHFFDLCLSGLHRHRLWNIGPRPSNAQMDANVENAVDAFLDGYRRRD
jgi:TetR/AcrR family transcriptional regulator, mexJK operon transcriptional repressor